MNTKITYRKTPHSVVSTLFSTAGVDLVHAWVFEIENDENSRLVKKWIPKCQCYVKDGTQDLPDYLFREYDVRKYHVDVWNAKAKNWRKEKKFLTNYELKRHFEELAEIQQSVDDMWSPHFVN